MTSGVLAYLGPPGSFSEEAARRFAKGAQIVPHNTVYATLNAVDDGQAGGALVPLENALGGSVVEVEDYLLSPESELRIVAEYLLRIELCLIGKVADLGEIRVVRSKAEAFQQCRGFLNDNLPNAVLEPWYSTSGAVKSLSDQDTPSGTVAIASSLSAEMTSLPIIKSAIQDTEVVNLTRFVEIAKNGATEPAPNSKTSLAFRFADEDQSGQLLKVLKIFGDAGVNLSKIASRPTRQGLGSYYIWIDFEGHHRENTVNGLLTEVKKAVSELKILGSYPRGI